MENFTPSKVTVANEVDVWIQDQTTSPFHSYFMSYEKDDIQLISGATKGAYSIFVTTGHGIETGKSILITYGDIYYQCISISGSTNEIRISMPLPIDFPIEGTKIVRGSIEIAVNGSITPVDFYCKIGPASKPIDIQHIHVFMEDNVDGDDSLYGGLSQLTNGTLGRYISDAGDFNLGLFKKNAHFIYRGGKQTYTNKAGGGNYSMDFSFDLKSIYGVVIRLDNSINSYLKITVKDDLTNLITHKIVATGQITLGE